MDLLVNGVGDAFSVKHWGTSFIVREQGYHLAIDCPDSYRRALATNGFAKPDGGILDVGDLDAIFLTHLHGDHVNGLEMTLAYRKFVTQKPLIVYTTAPVAELLWSHRLRASLGTLFDGETYIEMDFSSFGELHVIPWDEPTQLGPFEITTTQTIHHIPTAAIKLGAGEKLLGYSCDTAYDEDLLSWLNEADLIVHESAHGPAHTPLARLESLPQDVRDRMLVVHYPDETDVDAHELRFGREGETLTI